MDTPPVWVSFLIFALIVILPLGFVFIGGRLILKTLRFKERSQPASGTVIEVKVTNSGNNGEDTGDHYVYQPVFEFSSPDGTVLKGTSASSSSNMNFDIGSQHPILVDFSDPTIVHTKGNHALIIGVACMLLGGVISAFGISAVLSII